MDDKSNSSNSTAAADAQTADTNNPDGSTKPATSKPIYDEAQQHHIDAVILPNRLRRKETEVTDRLTGEFDERWVAREREFGEQLAAAKSSSSAEEALAAERERSKLAMEHIKASAEENAKLRTAIAKRDKADAMTKAIKGRFINENAALLIAEGAVQFDSATGEYVVLDEKGNIRVNASLEPISLDTYFGEIAEQHSYLAVGTTKGGTGSSSSSTNGAQTRQVLAKSDLKNDAQRIEFINKNGLRAFEKLPLRRDDND